MEILIIVLMGLGIILVIAGIWINRIVKKEIEKERQKKITPAIQNQIEKSEPRGKQRLNKALDEPVDVSLGAITEMTFDQLKKLAKEKGKITAVVRIRAYNAMFGLLAINLNDQKPKWLEPDEDGKTTMKFHHWFCDTSDEEKQKAFNLENNYFKITIVPAFRGDTDMGSQFGPNHDGLGIVEMERLFKIV